jgi:Zn-dependent M28 family amino/carboxypeptidase
VWLTCNASYEKYPYRIRFCWWGAEENNMYGSFYHVEQANITTVEGNRLEDYAVVLNFDMLASINYIFGIYEGISLPDEVSSAVKNATVKISQLFRDWFDKELLPWDHRAFVSSDHVPFLVAGVVCGGTFSGADDTKTLEQKNRYDKMLIDGYGGTAGAKYDPCYHQACDTIENINLFAYETMVKSAAHVLETLARTPNLKLWLYTS